MKNSYIKMKLENYPNFYEEFIKEPYECELYLDSDNIIVAYNRDNKDFIAPDGSTIVDMKHNGGIIIGFPGNITFFKFTNRENNPHFLDKLTEYLKSKGLNVEKDKNDLLVDGYKVAGYMDKWITKDIQWYGIHISLFVDNDLIKQICTPIKEMNKIPKGLSDYNITREEILRVLEVE